MQKNSRNSLFLQEDIAELERALRYIIETTESHEEAATLLRDIH